MTEVQPLNLSGTAEYLNGAQAEHAGRPMDDCPYGVGDHRRTRWFCGYLDSRADAKFGKLFERYGLSWP